VSRRGVTAAVVAAAVVLAAGAMAGVSPAAAEPVRDEVMSTQPLALVARGVAVSYERRVAPRVSAVVLGGLRAAALEDYSSQTVTAGGELRVWVREATPMRGPFVGFHASAGYTRLVDDAMGYVGGSTALSQRLDVGWRFTIRSRLAIAPTLGFGLREDLDSAGRLATTVRGQIAIGLEVGWMR
jgi:hypothetical protein